MTPPTAQKQTQGGAATCRRGPAGGPAPPGPCSGGAVGPRPNVSFSFRCTGHRAGANSASEAS